MRTERDDLIFCVSMALTEGLSHSNSELASLVAVIKGMKRAFTIEEIPIR